MTPEQSAVIATLAYTKPLKKGSSEGNSVGDLLFDENGNVKPSVRKDIPTGYTQDDWDKFLDEVKGDPGICDLVVKDVTINKADGAAMITLVDENTKQAVIAFQGTATSQGWDEDLKSGYGLTESQKIAIKYAKDHTKDLEGYYVTSTGHSKGGNEAALVAVECEGIDAAHAFDAPGNAQSYFDDPEHADKARRNSYKVAYYSNENCFVSPLNPRYDAPQYWLRSGHDEWMGMEGVRNILAFSPMAHSTNNLFDSEYGFDYADGPSKHQVEMNRFVRWLEQNLPPEDCRYLLDALGVLVGHLRYGDAEGDDPKYEDLSNILRMLDPKAMAILLVALEDYPYTAELVDALLADEALRTISEKYGDDIVKWIAVAVGAGTFSSLLAPKTSAFVAILGIKLGEEYLKMVEFYKKVTRLKMEARKKAKKAVDAGKKVYYELFHTHDFTEEKLARIESIVSSFKAMPLRKLYQDWKWLYAATGLFNWVSLSFIDMTVEGATKLLDEAVDAGLRTIRQKFQQAWEADGRCATIVAGCQAPLSEARALLKQLS